MDPQGWSYYELRFKVQYLEAKGSAFQDLFASVMAKVHPEDFMPCRPWGAIGDRKNDGYLKSGRTLFQVYAPSEITQAATLRKIEHDFTEALPYWREHFDTWVFVHNAREGLPPDVLAKLLALGREHAPVKVVQWGFEELLLRFRRLSPDSLRALYGEPPDGGAASAKGEAKLKRNEAQELARSGKRSDATATMLEALALAREKGDEAEEVEVLAGLALLSSDRRRGKGERQDYIQQAEKKADKLTSSAAKVIYLRARAAALQDQHDLAGAEAAYRKALAHCLNDAEDDKGNLATQGCIVRTSFVHFLCNEKRFDEARPLLEEAEAHARANREAEDGELFQAAMEAGIHFALDTADEDGAIRRIAELEDFASSLRLADRIGGDLLNIANHASHRKAHRAALAAAQGSVRLGNRCYDSNSPSFLVGALYTEAMVMAQAGEEERALPKAAAILDLCTRPEDEPIKQATHQLIAEIHRTSGDSQAAVDMARRALSIAQAEPENIAFAKTAVAIALNDDGQTEEALKQAREAWALASGAEVPAAGMIRILSDVANYASQLGADDVLDAALREVLKLPDEPAELKDSKVRTFARAFANRSLRQRLLQVLEEEQPATVAGTSGCKSLQEANAKVVRPLLRLWKDCPECLAGLYDFWGRGNFERLLLNARCFPNSFNVTLEVRSLEDVKRAVRLWGLYADFLILLWKGPTENGLAVVPFRADYAEPGGWGYSVCAGDVLRKKGSRKKWHPALSYIAIFPEEVAVFLATDARPFIEAGRLVVVPAVSAGCINPGHGPFEQLLAEAANAIPSVRWRGFEGTPIGSVPHSPDAPFELLAEVAETEADRLRKLRLLLLKRSRELRPDREVGQEAKLLTLEIDDALRDLESRNAELARRRGLQKAKEPIAGGTAPFRSTGQKLSDLASDSPFAPLFVLQSLGYGWRVQGPEIPRLPPRFEPQEGDVVGTWLAPPSPGWDIPTVVAPTSEP